jgi:hypothetical protein
MGDSTKSFNTSLSEGTLFGPVTGINTVLHKIDTVYTPEEYRKLLINRAEKRSFQ